MNKINTIEPKGDEAHELINRRAPFTYILRCENWYKIGFTEQSLSSRISSMRTGNPFPIHLVYAIQTERCKDLEKALHVHFSHRLQRGEWFQLSPEDENNIELFIMNFLWPEQEDQKQ